MPSAQSVPNPVESRIQLILKEFTRLKDNFRVAFLPHRSAAWRKSGKGFSAWVSTLFLLALLPLSAAYGETDAASQIDQVTLRVDESSGTKLTFARNAVSDILEKAKSAD